MAKDWGKIQAEYVSGNISYRKLAKKHKVSESALTERAVAEHWFQARKDYRSKTVVKSLNLSGDHRAAQMARIHELADRLLDKLEQAIGELGGSGDVGQPPESGGCRQRGSVDAAELKRLVETLAAIKKVMGVQADLDRQEQEARIAVLHKQAAASEASGGTIIVQMEGLDELAM